jgi:hypothetical protein
MNGRFQVIVRGGRSLMNHIVMAFGVSVTVAFAACGGTVTSVTGSTSGTGGGGTTAVGTTGTGTAGADAGFGEVPPTIVSGTDAGYPPIPPDETSACQTEGLLCSYTTGECTVMRTCTSSHIPDPWYCGALPLNWADPANEYSPAPCGGCAGGPGCVPCKNAKTGDPCDVPGFTCILPGGGNCNNTAHCQNDHTWFQGSQAGCCI